jgi:hypothetical protein
MKVQTVEVVEIHQLESSLSFIIFGTLPSESSKETLQILINSLNILQ